MSIWGKSQILVEDYKKFWLAPAGVSSQNKSAAESSIAEFIAWLLETDTALRKASASSAAFSPAAAIAAATGSTDQSAASIDASGTDATKTEAIMLPASPDVVMEGGDPIVMGNVADISATTGKVLSALHFIMVFWPFDSHNKRLHEAHDIWWQAVNSYPNPADERWAVQLELAPGILLGNINDPFWNIPDIIINKKYRLYGYALMRTLVRYHTWNFAKFMADTQKIIEKSEEKSTLLHAMFLLQMMLKYCGRDMKIAIEETIKNVASGTVYSDVFGTAQEQLMTALQQEQLSPGLGFRRIIQRYIAYGESEGKLNTVYCIAARSNNRTTEELLALMSLWSPREYPPMVIKASLLAHILGLNFSIDPTCVGVQFIQTDVMNALYDRVMTVMDNCLKAPTKEEAENYRNKELTNIYGELQCHIKPRAQTELVDLVSIYPVNLHMLFTPVYYASEQFPTGSQWNVVHHVETMKLLDSLVDSPEKDYQEKCGGRMSTKIAIVGDDFLLRLVAGTYLHFCSSKPESSQLIDLLFYLVPSPSCRFAEMLANEDNAYRSQVIDSIKYLLSINPRFPDRISQFQLPERSKNLMRQQEQQSTSAFTPRELPNPASCISMIIDSFCADAQCVLNVPITICQCDDLQKRFCHSHVFFSECVMMAWMEKQQTKESKESKQFFNITMTYDAVGSNGNVHRVTENKRVCNAIVSRTLSTSFKMEVICTTEDESKKGRSQTQVPVSNVDISVGDSCRGLFVIVDGQQCGPYTRLRFVKTSVSMRFAHFLSINK